MVFTFLENAFNLGIYTHDLSPLKTRPQVQICIICNFSNVIALQIL